MPKNTPTIISMSRWESVWGIRYLLFQLIFLPSLLSALLHSFLPSFPTLGINFIRYLINFVVMISLLHSYLEKDGRAVLGHIPRALLAAAVGFVLYWVGNFALSAAIGHWFPAFFNVNDTNISTVGRNNIMLIALSTVVFVPTAEELLYRGVVFGLLRKHSRLLAYILSVTIFCAIHVMGYFGRYEPLHLALCFVQYIPAGLVLAGAYEFSGSIYAPILIHTSINLIGILSMR